jgi:hypothetical protein
VICSSCGFKIENHLKTRIDGRTVLKLDLKDIRHEALEFLVLMMG